MRCDVETIVCSTESPIVYKTTNIENRVYVYITNTVFDDISTAWISH